MSDTIAIGIAVVLGIDCGLTIFTLMLVAALKSRIESALEENAAEAAAQPTEDDLAARMKKMQEARFGHDMLTPRMRRDVLAGAPHRNVPVRFKSSTKGR